MLLQENGDALLTETTDHLLLEGDDMPANYIECDHVFAAIRKGDAGIIKAREAREDLRIAKQAMLALIDGDGSQDSHFALLATEGSYAANGYATANAAARKHFEEISSLYDKISKPTGQGDATGAAIDQISGFLNI